MELLTDIRTARSLVLVNIMRCGRVSVLATLLMVIPVDILNMADTEKPYFCGVIVLTVMINELGLQQHSSFQCTQSFHRQCAIRVVIRYNVLDKMFQLNTLLVHHWYFRFQQSEYFPGSFFNYTCKLSRICTKNLKMWKRNY